MDSERARKAKINYLKRTRMRLNLLIIKRTEIKDQRRDNPR